MGIQCPEELSVIGFGDETWVGLIDPPLTTLERDVKGLSRLAANMLFEKISTGNTITKERSAQVGLIVRESTRILENGPYGEKAVSPSEIILSPDEKNSCGTDITGSRFLSITPAPPGRSCMRKESGTSWNNMASTSSPSWMHTLMQIFRICSSRASGFKSRTL